jgi:hypothetical protein
VTSIYRLDSAYGALRRLTVEFGTDLRIMVPPFESGSRHSNFLRLCRKDAC